MKEYIWNLEDWPNFYWDNNIIAKLQQLVISNDGYLKGLISTFEPDFIERQSAKIIATEIERSWKIEGEHLEALSVYSSVCRKLNIENQINRKLNSHLDGIVDVTIDAIRSDNKILDKDRLFNWHRKMFPTNVSQGSLIESGKYRDFPIDVVSGEMGKEKILYTAIDAKRINYEMNNLLEWINSKFSFSNYVKSAISHLWFLTIHPFEDGNGRLARAISDFVIYQNSNDIFSFYSISYQIKLEQKMYYEKLNKAQTNNSLDITDWISWYLNCINNSINQVITEINKTIKIEKFYRKINQLKINKRQKKMIDKIMDDFKGNITTVKWAKICNCSQDTATRDINDLIKKNILKKNAKGPHTNYELIF